jgi:hypothetical protein
MHGDRVLVQTITPGTGTYQLGVALDGFLTMAQAGITSGSRVSYCVQDSLTEPTQFEIGEGIYTSGTPATLSRVQVLRTHGGGSSAVNWGVGTRYVFLAVNAKRLAILDTDGLLPNSIVPQALMSQVFSGGTFSVPHNTSFNAPWNQMGVNSLGAQPGANPAYALVPPTAGLYRAALCITFGPSTVGQRLAEIIIGGVTRARVRSPSSTGIVDLVCAWEGPMEAGQNVQTFLYQDSGAALACGGTTQSSFTLTRL